VGDVPPRHASPVYARQIRAWSTHASGESLGTARRGGGGSAEPKPPPPRADALGSGDGGVTALHASTRIAYAAHGHGRGAAAHRG
jgi:hypothetical protein